MTKKGLTPVIAIVLLLFITVGAVGVVYTQFSGIVDSGEASTQQTLGTLTQSISIVSGSNDCNVVNTGSEGVSLDNAVGVNPETGSVVDTFSTSLDSGDSVSCSASGGEPYEIRVNGSTIASVN